MTPALKPTWELGMKLANASQSLGFAIGVLESVPYYVDDKRVVQTCQHAAEQLRAIDLCELAGVKRDENE